MPETPTYLVEPVTRFAIIHHGDVIAEFADQGIARKVVELLNVFGDVLPGSNGHAPVEVEQLDQGDLDELLDARQVSELLHCSVSHIYTLVKTGQLRALHIGKTAKRFRRGDIVAFERTATF